MLVEPLYALDFTSALRRLCLPALDAPMEALSIAGEGYVLAIIAIAVAWRAHRGGRDALRSALRGLVALAVTGILVVVIKRIVHAPRPLEVLGPRQACVLLAPLRSMSFPSGHSAGVAALALWASGEPCARKRWWPWLFAFLCGVSRVYVGAHWVTDVIGGWLLGLATAAIVCRAWPRPAAATAGPAPAVAGTARAATAAPPLVDEVDPCG
ncbi:MAG TPA: phosphatase PAP2 family protein [Anaeromyxobacter sp.]